MAPEHMSFRHRSLEAAPAGKKIEIEVTKALQSLSRSEEGPMAVMAIFTGQGFTKQMYEALRSEVKWETNLAPGGLVHSCGFDTAGDLHVADVWESEELMNTFVGERLIPGFEKLGIPMPAVSVFPVHNLNLYPDVRRFILK